MTVPFCLAEIFQNEWNKMWKSVTKPPFFGGEFMTHGRIVTILTGYLILEISNANTFSNLSQIIVF